VMHRMETPQRPAVEQPVLPVAEKIADDEDFDALEPERLRGEDAVTLRQGPVVQTVERDQGKENDTDRDRRDRPRDDGRPQPVEAIGPEALAEYLLPRHRRPEPGDDPIEERQP